MRNLSEITAGKTFSNRMDVMFFDALKIELPRVSRDEYFSSNQAELHPLYNIKFQGVSGIDTRNGWNVEYLEDRFVYARKEDIEVYYYNSMNSDDSGSLMIRKF